ncbi:MAG: ISNCY family transposase [Methanobrevibacter sp.]|nr:ISNCY family transposase [Methanobrevibacter sp.]
MKTCVIKHKDILPIYVKGLYNHKYTLKQASESTGYSIVHLSRLRKRYAMYGTKIFEHGNKGRVSKFKIDTKLRQRIVCIYTANYSDVNFSYFQKCLKEFEGISIGLSTLRNIMSEYGIKSPEARKIKKKKSVHRPRLRRAVEGDLLQIDGTPYAWFYKSGDNKRYCLSGGIDDATGKITGLYFTENECLYGYLEVLRQTCRDYGVPREVYSDRAAIFCFTPRGKHISNWEKLEVMHEKKTQWQRICNELHINQILAWSPEAKGRVERMWRTIQGQLPIWFYKHGVKTVDEANKIIDKYIKEFNASYAVKAADDDNFYIDAPTNLDDILCAQFSRRADGRGCVNFQGTTFYAPTAPDFSRRDVLLCINESGLYVKYMEHYYPLVPTENFIRQVVDDGMPQVVANIIYRYLYAFAKEISA